MTFARVAGALGGSEVLGRGIIQVGADTARLRRDMALATATVNSAASGWGRAFKVAGMALAGVGLAAGGFAAAGVKASMDLDNALSQVYSMTGASREQMALWREEILKLSPQMADSPTKLAEALYYVASAGFNGKDAMEVVRQSAMAATSGMTDTMIVADGLTSVLNAYNVSAKDAGYVTDILTQTVIDGKTEWADLARSLGPVTVQSRVAGISLEEMGAALATLTRNGYTSTYASYVLRGAMRSLAAPTDRQWKTFKALGIEYDTNNLKTKGLLGTLQELEAQIGKVVTVQIRNKDGTINVNKTLEQTERMNRGAFDRWRKLTGGIHGFMLAQVLLNNEAETYTEILERMDDVQGKTVDSFEKTKELNMGVQFARLANTVTVAAIRIGDRLVPALRSFTDWLIVALPAAFDLISDVWTQHLAGPLGRLAGALGTVMGHVHDILFGWGEWLGQAADTDGFRNTVDLIAGVLGKVVDSLARIVGYVGDFLGNENIQNLLRFLAIWTGIRVAMSGAQAAIRGITRLGAGTASFLTGGLLGRRGAAGPAGADGGMTQAARAHTGAAQALTRAAGALSGAAGGLRRSDYGPQYLRRTPGQPLPPIYGGRPYVTGTSGEYGRAMPFPLETSRQETKALMTGRAVAIAHAENWKKVSLDAQERYLQALGGVNAATRQNVLGTQRQSGLLRERLARFSRDVVRGMALPAQALGSVLGGGVRGMGAVLAGANRAEEAARRAGSRLLTRVSDNLAESLRVDPMRRGGAFLPRGGGSMFGRAFSVAAETIRTDLRRATFRFNTRVSGIGQAISQDLGRGLGTAMNRVEGAWRGVQRLNDRMVQSVARGLTGIGRIPGRLGGFGGAGLGFVSHATMQFGAAVDRAISTARVTRMSDVRDAGARLATQAHRAIGTGVMSAIRGVSRGATGGAVGMRQIRDASYSMAGRMFAQARDATISGLRTAGGAAVAAPRQLAGAARAATAAMVGGMATMFMGAVKPQDIVQNGQVVGQQMARSGGLLGAARGALGVVGRAFWPLIIAEMVSGLVAQPIGSLVGGAAGERIARSQGLIELGSNITHSIVSAITGNTAWLSATVDEIELGNLRISSADIGKMGFDGGQIDAMAVGTLEGRGIQMNLEASQQLRERMRRIVGETSDQWALRVFEAAQEAGLDTSEMSTIVGEGRGRRRQWNMKNVVAIAEEIGIETLNEMDRELRTQLNTALADLGYDIEDRRKIPLLDESARVGIADYVSAYMAGWINEDTLQFYVSDVLDKIKLPKPPTQMELDRYFQADPNRLTYLPTGTGLVQGFTPKELAIQQMSAYANELIAQQGKIDEAYKQAITLPDGTVDTFRRDAIQAAAAFHREFADEMEAGAKDPAARARILSAFAQEGVFGLEGMSTADIEADVDGIWERVHASWLEAGEQGFISNEATMKEAARNHIVQAFTNGVTEAEMPILTELARLFDIDLEEAAGEGRRAQWAKNYQDLLTNAAKAGIDLSKSDTFQSLAAAWDLTFPAAAGKVDKVAAGEAIRDLMQLAMRQGIDLAEDPVLAALVEMYSDVLGAIPDATEAKAMQSAADVVWNMINHIPELTPEAKSKLVDLMSTAMTEAAAGSYTTTTEAAAAYIQTFVDGMPEGPVKTAMADSLANALESVDDSTPNTEAAARDFLQDFVDGLPAKYDTLKTELTRLLQTAPGAAVNSPQVQGAAKRSGAVMIDTIGSGSATDAKSRYLRNRITWTMGQAARSSTPVRGTSLYSTLMAAGGNMINAVASGITAAGDAGVLRTAMNQAIATARRPLPGSPVKEGPMKHPFLPNAGRKIIEQISQGMSEAAFELPPLGMDALKRIPSFVTSGLAAPAGEFNQHLAIEKMYLTDEQYKRSALEELSFLMPRR